MRDLGVEGLTSLTYALRKVETESKETRLNQVPRVTSASKAVQTVKRPLPVGPVSIPEKKKKKLAPEPPRPSSAPGR